MNLITNYACITTIDTISSKQGFGSVTFKPADPDLLDTDPHEKMH